MNDYDDEEHVMTTTQTNHNLEQLEQLLETLLQQKAKLAEEKKYTEAEEIKDQIDKLRKKLVRKKKQSIVMQHDSEMKQLEEKYSNEIKEFNDNFKEELKGLEENSKIQQEELKKRHQSEKKELFQPIQNDTNNANSIKFSSQHIQYIQTEEKLAKNDKFKEAQVVALKRLALEKIEIESFNRERLKKLTTKDEKLEKKHELEIIALKKKIEVDFEKRNNVKDIDYDKLVYIYKNRRMCLESQQKQEKILSENDNLSRQKNTSEAIRSLQRPGSKHLFASKSTKPMKRSINGNNVLKSEIDIDGSNNINVTGNDET